MMIVAAARALARVRTVFVGVGLPNVACNLARITVAPEIAINARRVFHVLRLGRRSFVERLDFVTSPGHPSDRGARSSLRGAGPELVVTDLALLDFDNDDREMQLASLHPGVTLDQV